MKPTWKAFLLLAGIFLAGAVAGGFAALRFAHAPAPPPPPASAPHDAIGPQTMRKFLEKLALTPEQKQRIGPHLTRGGEQLGTHRREALKIVESMNAAIANELTPPQRAKLAEMQQRERERRKKSLDERAQREARPPGGGGFDERKDFPPPGGKRSEHGGPRQEYEERGERLQRPRHGEPLPLPPSPDAEKDSR